MLVRLATTPLARSGEVGPVAIAAAPAPDLLAATWDVLAAAPTVLALVGRPAGGPGGWLWRERAASGSPLPLAVLSGDDGFGGAQPTAYEGVAVEGRTVRIDAYAAAGATPSADDLARAIRDALVEGADRLAWINGNAIDRSAVTADPEPLPSRYGRGGRTIRGRRVRLDVAVQFSPRG